jgi:aspartate-semialdehyde dehydrogenase
VSAPAARAPLSIALSGAHDLVAGAVLKLLGERDFPVAAVLALSDAVGAEVEAPTWGEHTLELESSASAELGGIDLLFLCPPCDDPLALLERAVEAGARVIDLIGVDREQVDQVLLAPDLAMIDGSGVDRLPDGRSRVYRSPDPLALILATVILPLIAEAGMASLRVQWLLPASTLGESGVRELAGQAENLFNQRELPAAVFGRQLAFNLLAGTSVPFDPLRATARDLATLLGDLDAPSDLRGIWVPVFFGAAATVWLETAEYLDPARASELLRSAPGLLLSDPVEQGGKHCPSPVEDALDSDAVHVALLGGDGAGNRGHVLWVVADDVRRGRALNALRIAEMLPAASEAG